jgi:hypothetical protein
VVPEGLTQITVPSSMGSTSITCFLPSRLIVLTTPRPQLGQFFSSNTIIMLGTAPA